MGIFDSLFKSEAKNSNWPGEQLEDLGQLDAISAASFTTPQLIFKHSTRCSISRFVLADFIKHFSYSSLELGAHYLDLLNHRDISNAIAERFDVVQNVSDVEQIEQIIRQFPSRHGRVQPDVVTAHWSYAPVGFVFIRRERV